VVNMNDFQLAFEGLKQQAWDAWIWGDSSKFTVFLAPPSSRDADLSARFGFQLANSPDGMRLLHDGHSNEAT